MVSGKRPWWKDLYQRYMEVVNTFVNIGEETRLEEGVGRSSFQADEVERAMGFELTTSCLGSWLQDRLFINTPKPTKRLTPSGEKRLIEALHTFSKAIMAPVNEVTKEDLINLKANYQDKPWRRHDLYIALKTFFKWANTKYNFDNPMANIAAPKSPEPILHTITPDDVEPLQRGYATSRLSLNVIVMNRDVRYADSP